MNVVLIKLNDNWEPNDCDHCRVDYLKANRYGDIEDCCVLKDDYRDACPIKNAVYKVDSWKEE